MKARVQVDTSNSKEIDFANLNLYGVSFVSPQQRGAILDLGVCFAIFGVLVVMNLLPDNNDFMNAIDFQALYRQEKRKAAAAAHAEKRRQRAAAAAATAAAAADDRESPLVEEVSIMVAETTVPSVSLSSLLSAAAVPPSADDDDEHTRLSFPPWTLQMPHNSSDSLESLSSLQCLTRDDYQSAAPLNNNDDKDVETANQSGSHIPPPHIYYQTNVMNQAFHNVLYEWLTQLPLNTTGSNEDASINGHWTTLPHAHRRVAVFDGVWLARQQQQQQQQLQLQQQQPALNSIKSALSNKDRTNSCWFPPPLQLVVDWIVASQVVPLALSAQSSRDTTLEHDVIWQCYPNHMLVNHYPDANMGILPHTDGPAYAPWTITLSLGLGCNVLLHFKASNCKHTETSGRDDAVSMILHGGGSLVLFCHEAYTLYRHSIAEYSAHQSAHFAAAHQDVVVTEFTDDNCWNAPSGTAVHRQDDRISITIRHKLCE
jgi:2OG-Fe(II) oxygenase superfamily